ncbi:MAG: hypothetical protein ACLPTM_05025 [Steroidobacteraceae bacterium]
MRIWLALAAVVAALHAPLAYADRDTLSGAPLPPRPPEKTSPIHDRFYVLAAFYSPTVQTNVRVDPTTNVAPGTLGTPVNAENELGLAPRMHQGRVEFMFRMRDRNKLRVEYYEADRTGNQLLANNIVFGNQTFDAGQLVQSEVDWRSFGLTYTYSFFRSDSFEVGTGLGVFFLQVYALGSIPATGQSQSESAAEPLPTLPLDLTWAISRRFAATARANYLKAEISGVDGSFLDLHGDLQYRWNPNFTIGLGYTSMHISLTDKGGNPPGVVSLHFDGPEAFIRFSF